MTDDFESGRNALQQGAQEVSDLLSEVIDSLRFYAGAGCSGGDCSPDNLERIRRWAEPDCLRPAARAVIPAAEAVRPAAAQAVGPAAARAASPADPDLPACAGCSLGEHRPDMIAGSGSGRAGLMLVAGYPSFPAVRGKSSYAGEAGQLLTRIIAAMKLTPDDVYLTHVVRCRPAEGREPSAGETQQCLSFLEKEIRSVAPRVICALGGFAARALLGGNEPLERRRGRFHERGGLPVMPTWHPEDILDDPDKKRPVWEDIQKVMARLDKK